MIEKAMTLAYPVGDKLYLNLTNRCPCACTFCLRQHGSTAYGSQPLWLEREPTAAEMQEAIIKANPEQYTEVVFCGYGEPTEALDVLCETADFLKKQYPDMPIRLNTNGLSDKIHGEKTAQRLEGRVDIISISLNAGTKAAYHEVTRPKFADAFEAMQQFAVDCKAYVPKVMFTIVDILPQEEQDAAKVLAEKLGIYLRIREYIED